MTIHLDYFGTKLWGSTFQRVGAQCLLIQVPSGISDKALSHKILREVMGIRVNSGHVSIYKVYTYIAHMLFKK